MGLLTRHIGTFRELFNKLLLEDTFEGATIQSIVDHTCEATNRHVSYNGMSPSQWFTGRTRHPLTDTAEASPSLTPGSEFEQHLIRGTTAAQQFRAADANTHSANGFQGPF